MSKTRIIIVGLALVVLTLVVWKWRHSSHSISTHGGESLAIAPITTPFYLQRDPQWSKETIGGSQETLAQVGCTICCLAMALDANGIALTPQEINTRLKDSGGYTGSGLLKWEAISTLTTNKIGIDYIGDPVFERMDGALKNNQPVIAKVLLYGTVNHWVLIVGKDSTEYLIRDPLGDGKNLKRLSDLATRLEAIRILKKV